MPSQPDRLLIIDTDAETRGALSRRLTRSGYAVDVAAGGSEAIEKIQQAQYDLVLLDRMTPARNGLDLLSLLRATCSDLPIMMVTAADQNQTAVKALIEARSSRAKNESNAFVRPAAEWATSAAAQKEIGQPFAVLLLDLDGFNTIHDGFGRRAGERVLAETVARICAAAGPAPIFRIGGNEFAILIESVASDAAAEALAAKILANLARPMAVHGFEIAIHVSIGIVMCQAGDNLAPADLLSDADLAMRRARQLGQNRWQMFEPEMRDRAENRMALAHDLRWAVERDQLAAHYQPIVNLGTRAIVGFEALLRWRHPRHGLLHPADFIPLAEETGLISALGEWILREACLQLKIWQTRFPSFPLLSMNVNLSVKQLDDPGLAHRVRAVLEETGIPPETLKLELTESALMMESESAKSVLKDIQALGIGLKLDDFGTGYSSLSNLWALHFDALKIDRSFVMKLAADPEAHGIVETMVKLAHALDMTVVAEGIEEERQIHELFRLGCETGQGFYFSQPVDAEAVESHLLGASAKGFPPALVA